MTYRRPNRERAFRQARRTIVTRRRPTPPYFIENVPGLVQMSSITADQLLQRWGEAGVSPVGEYQMSPR